MSSTRVDGDGPMPAPICIIGQRPGWEEVKYRRPFVGKSGLELNRYLADCCGVSREDVYVTNLVKDFDGDDDLTDTEIERDWPELLAEIECCEPKYLVLLGGYATKRFLGTETSLDWANGLAWPAAKGYIMPIVHPAAGLHRQAEAVRVWWGFQQLGRLLRGERLSEDHLSDTCTGDYTQTNRDSVLYRCAVDTEGSREHPWCLSFSARAGKGFVQRTGVEFGDSIILHNALHDLPVLKSLGCKMGEFTDTMVMAALLGTEPMGLKALARRHCGMIMMEYEDVVAPAKRELALEYLSRMLDCI